MSTKFVQTVKGDKRENLQLNNYSGVTLEKATLLKKPDNVSEVIVTVSYFPSADGENADAKPTRENETIAKFTGDQKEIQCDFLAMDEMEACIFTTAGCEVKVEGTYMALDDEDEEDEGDDDDDDFQEDEDSD